MTTLHVTNGDIVVDHLRRAGLAADALAWADVLHEGPVPAGLDDAGLRRVRAEFLAGRIGLDPGAVRRRSEDRDRALSVNHAGEYLLWFEADLYDQLQIAQILAALGDSGADRVTKLVCIGEYPASPTSAGWASSSPGSSPACWRPPPADRRGPRPGRRRLGGAAGGRPRRAGRGRGQPLAPAALPRRGLRPASAASTLDPRRPLPDRAALPAATQQGGEPSAGAVFARLGEREARPFLADLFCFRILAWLAGTRVPLVELDPPAGR